MVLLPFKEIDKNTLFLVLMKSGTDMDLAITRMDDVSKKINGLI
ncbi:MAG: hypothetical protein C5S45_04135 [Candidatus Methanocomedens sp.]|nr:MAG: hypothetical protein C5S45_04135 [ANME-2 cluster archaeon]